MHTYLFHGPSGCGKDTQVDLLMEMGNTERIATGEMFRKLYEENDPDGIDAHKYWSVGIFNPDEQVYKLLGKWMKRYDKSKNWIFVSVVRRVTQIPMFDKLLSESNRKLDKFVHFNLSEETAIERMSLRTVCPICGTNYHPKFKKEKVDGFCDVDGGKLFQREDDKPEQIKKRLSEYNSTIAPILDEFRRRGQLLEIDASPSIEDIHKDLVNKLGLK